MLLRRACLPPMLLLQDHYARNLRDGGSTLQCNSNGSRSDCGVIVTGAERLPREWKQLARWHLGAAAIGEKAMPDDFRLLLDPIASERFPPLELITVPAERMPH